MNPAQMKGQGLVEYSSIIMLGALIVIFIIALLGPQVGKMDSNVSTLP